MKNSRSPKLIQDRIIITFCIILSTSASKITVSNMKQKVSSMRHSYKDFVFKNN